MSGPYTHAELAEAVDAVEHWDAMIENEFGVYTDKEDDTAARIWWLWEQYQKLTNPRETP